MRHRATMRLATGVLTMLAACSAPDRTERSVALGTDAAATIPDSGAVTTTFSADAPPDAARPILADACVRGEPGRGTPWVIDRAEPGLVTLAAEAISSLSTRDSSRIVARLASTADGLPGDTTLADFRGLPVVVRDGHRLVAAPGDTILVAFIARRLPMESNPLEEEFTLVAIPGARQGVRDPWIAQWYVRQVGREESLEQRELVLALRRPDDGVSLLFVHEGGTGLVLELVTRTAGAWILEWRGPMAHCE